MKTQKKRNLVAKDLRTPKYRMRVELSQKLFDRNKQKSELRKQVNEQL